MKLGGTNIRQDAPGQYGHHDWNGNADDVVADEADEESMMQDGLRGQAPGGATQDFDKAYKNLVQQMLY